MKKTIISLAITACIGTLLTVSTVNADDKGRHGWNFKALDTSAVLTERAADLSVSPWKLPKGYKAIVVSDERDLNIYPDGRDDWHDMNVVNETGPQAGRFMYRTHEVRLGRGDTVVDEIGGTVSVVDLKTGETRILAQQGGLDDGYTALDGIRWTPWGTVLFAEETTGGRLFELVLNNDMMSAAEIIDRPAVGRLAHEGIDLDTEGNVYVVDEFRGRSSSSGTLTSCDEISPCGGGVYKFIPDTYGDLSTGELYVLKVDGPDGTGKASWEGPIDPLNARKSGSEFGGESYQRPEDLEIIGDTLYVAITEGPRDSANNFKEYYEGRVIALNMKTMQVTNFVKPDVNAPVEIGQPGDEGHQTGFDSVDNLAEAPNGDLVMIEDNKPSDIWFASTMKVNEYGASEKVKLFASLSDKDAEGTGIYFSPTDPNTLFVNIQHSNADDGDGTWAITKKRGYKFKSKRHHKDD